MTSRQVVKRINLSMDVRHAVHGLDVSMSGCTPDNKTLYKHSAGGYNQFMNNNTERLLASGILKCPRCSGELQPGNTLSCSVCSFEYPTLDSIPLLTPEPEEMIGLWQNRLGNFFNSQQRNIQSNARLIQSTELYPPLLERLKTVTQARVDNLKTIMNLFLPLRDLGAGIPPTKHADNVGSFLLLAYLLRDWGWDTDEVDILCNKVIDLLPRDHPVESLLVIGAGGCRASYNLHHHYQCPLTVSVDISPLMLLAASRIVAGGTLDLYQILPNNIRSKADNVTLWELHAPRKADNDFLFSFADASKLPFADNSFQTVLTPFIIDEVGEDLRNFAPKVNKLIEPGGYWVNYGAMSFLPGFNYTAEEVLSIVGDSGFRIMEHGFSTQAHAAPRESCQRQVYDCLYFSAIKK